MSTIRSKLLRLTCPDAGDNCLFLATLFVDSSKKHIVLLTTWFPPKNGVAVNRMLGFVRYLDRSRNVLTVVTDGADSAASSDAAAGYSVVRFPVKSMLTRASFIAGEPRLFHFMKVFWNVTLNRFRGAVDRVWVKSALAALESLHARNPVDLIVSSYAPAHAHVAAGAFVKKHPRVRWIADMRDEMSLNPHFSSAERRQLAGVEKMVNAHASAVTSVSRPILDDFKRLLPAVRRFEEVRNGYDHELIFDYGFNRTFTVCYCGTFYGKRKPDTFFAGLSVFLQKNPTPVSIRFIGVHRNFQLPPKLEASVEFLPACNSDEAIGWMASADANLLVLPKVTGKGVFSGKIFDYLSVGKPIIAVVDPKDVAAELIMELNAGFVADFDDVKAISKAIENAYLLWQRQTRIHADSERIRLLHRRFEVEKLNKLIEQLTVG